MKSIRRVDRRVDIHGNIRYTNEYGRLHRTDGPAYESPNGYRVWYIDGLLHREDGPARIHEKGSNLFVGVFSEEYYLNGIPYSKEDWEKEVLKFRLGRIKDL